MSKSKALGCLSDVRERPSPPYKYNKSVRNEKGIGSEMCLAIVPGIVPGDVPVSYWPVFPPVPSNSPTSLCES